MRRRQRGQQAGGEGADEGAEGEDGGEDSAGRAGSITEHREQELEEEQEGEESQTGVEPAAEEFLGDITTFAELAIPLAVVTTDIATGRVHVVGSGPLLPALLASAAVPGIFPAVELDGRALYDGGVVANVPMRQAVAMGARSLIVLDCAFPGRLPAAPHSIADVLLYTALLTMRNQASLEAPVVAEHVPVVYLRGPEVELMSPLDFSHTAKLIDVAYEAARTFLGPLRVAGPGLYGSPWG